jgi:hypothetical protein
MWQPSASAEEEEEEGDDSPPPMHQPSASAEDGGDSEKDDDMDDVDDELEKESEKDIQTTTTGTIGATGTTDGANKSEDTTRKLLEQKQIEFIEKTTLQDVIVDDTNPVKVGRLGNDVTFLQSIKGCPSKRLSTLCLRKFCSQHRITGYKNKSKTFLCNLIVERMKTTGLDKTIYPEDFGKGKTSSKTSGDGNGKTSKKKTLDTNGSKGSKKKASKLSKNAKPPAVTQDGSYWRAIVTFFLQTMSPHVIKLGNNPSIDKVDGRRFLHDDIWVLLAAEYNRPDHPDLKTFLKNDVYFEQAQVPEDMPSKFDVLTPIELSQLLSHIQSFYRKAKRLQRTSGNHCPITKHIGPRPWLLLYDKCVQESSISMKALVSGDLPAGVGGSYLKRLQDADANASDSDDDKPKKKVKTSKQENEKLRVARAMEAFGEAATERASLLKSQAKETSEMRAAELDKRLSASYGEYKIKVKEGRADLRALKREMDYDSESSEAEDVKQTIAFFKDKAASIFDQLENKKRFDQLENKKRLPRIVVIPEDEKTERSSTARSSSTSESSLPLPRPAVAPRPPRVSDSTRVINSEDEDELPDASGVSGSV